MCLCVILLIKVVLLENFLQRPHSALRCCFSCLSVVQGHGTVTMVNFFVLVCLGQHAQLFGQTQCYCGHEAFEDAPNTEPDDLVLCRWASNSPMKPCGGLEKVSRDNRPFACRGLWTAGPAVSRVSLLFSLWISVLPAPSIAEANSVISLSVLSYVTTPFCFS